MELLLEQRVHKKKFSGLSRIHPTLLLLSL